MKHILLLGGGKSSTVLMNYLLERAGEEQWQLTIGDMQPELIRSKTKDSTRATVVQFNLSDAAQLQSLVKQADLVISMLPAMFHPLVAKECLRQGRNMVTASYVSDDMRTMAKDVEAAGLLFLNEMGVDPGIDHMSAMKVIDEIRAKGGKMTAFESFTGGLLAPESEKDNPWRYKFTWNPRNVVLAGQGVAKFIQMGQYKYIPYHRLFRRTELINIPGYGMFEGYGNRDSLGYREQYGLQDVHTMYRGTLRRPGFCRSWDVFVSLGATDDSYIIQESETMTYRQFINSFLAYHPTDSVELKLAHYLRLDLDSEEMYKLQWLGIFDDKPIGLKNATPAQILQKILEDKWSLEPDDKDMLVMWHKFNYELEGRQHEKHSFMVSIGKDTLETAMATTVGLPVGIAVKMILQGRMPLVGVHIPTIKAVYEPLLEELGHHGISFIERDVQ
ncbi:MAG: saccharopine dehydrogenase C-terminal domain-containing protein [Chitinophagales bacterium]|nr:saccharopine dehydrogenase C-terminal domain-containing protein [Chitinophagales bacterium]